MNMTQDPKSKNPLDELIVFEKAYQIWIVLFLI
jgi:hypothetical protein